MKRNGLITPQRKKEIEKRDEFLIHSQHQNIIPKFVFFLMSKHSPTYLFMRWVFD